MSGLGAGISQMFCEKFLENFPARPEFTFQVCWDFFKKNFWCSRIFPENFTEEKKFRIICVRFPVLHISPFSDGVSTGNAPRDSS
jgi:hypothetical protein